MSDSGPAEWLGREDLAWNILLVARLPAPPPVDALRTRLQDLAARSGWPAETDVAEGDDLDVLLASLAEVRGGLPASVGRAPDGLVVRGHHAYVDGLGLLAVLRDLLDGETRSVLASTAGGVELAPSRSTLATVADRLVEAVARPPAPVAARTDRSHEETADVFASRVLPRPVRTSELAHAAVQAVSARNADLGARGSRVALAVGVSTVGGHDLRVGDDSGFLRLPGAERLDAPDLAAALDTAPLQVGGTARSGSARRAGALIRWASRVLSSRLGSTVLVSHLGGVRGGDLSGLAFYPLAGNGSGVSLGAATVEGRTTLTLRARGWQHGPSDLDDLLAAVVARLA